MAICQSEPASEAEADATWHDLTVSTDRDDATAADRDPLGAVAG